MTKTPAQPRRRWFRAYAAGVHAVIGPCDRMRERMLEWLERKAARPALLRMHLHMRFCPPCQRYLTRYLQSVELARSALPEPAPPGLSDQLIRYVHDHAEHRR